MPSRPISQGKASVSRSQIYIRAFDPSQLYGTEDSRSAANVTRKITAPRGDNGYIESIWERVQRERGEHRFDTEIIDR